MPSPRGKGFRRRLRRAAVALLVIVPLGLAGAWLAFQHKPGWYRPVEVTEEVFQRAQADTASLADSISHDVVSGRTADVTLADAAVNEWLACLPRLLPEEYEAIPPEIGHPAVHFGSDELRVGAYVARDGWHAILSVGLAVSVSEDGQTVRVALNDVRGGSLPVPRVVLDRVLEPLLQEALAAQRGHRRGGTADRLLRQVRSVDDLYEGITLENRFVWPNGERPFRIEAITIDEGTARIRLDPL
jgi:hypothetical protein